MSGPLIRLGRTLTGSTLALPLDRLLGNHWHIRGRTGSMKTVFITALCLLLLKVREQMAVCIDLGGDKAWLWQVKQLCEQQAGFGQPGRPCRIFSLDPRHGGSHFDPIKSLTATEQNLSRVGSSVAFSLSLVYGEGYGKSFYGRVNTATLIEALETLAARGNVNPGLHDLARELRRMARRQRAAREASEALYAVDQLLRYTQLEEHPNPEANIDIARAFRDSEALYFYLPTLFDPQPARAVASLAIWSVALEAARRLDAGDPERRTHVYVDEFAQVVGSKSLEDLLTQVRKTGVQFYLMHQSTDQLMTRDHDLAAIVRDNCPLKVLFTVTNERDLEELQFYSRDVVRQRRGQSIQRHSVATSQQEVVEPELTRNQIRDVSDTAMQAFFVQQLGDGHHEPQPFVVEPAVSKEVHAALSRKPLRLVADPAVAQPAPVDPAVAAWRSELQALWDAKQAALSWEDQS